MTKNIDMSYSPLDCEQCGQGIDGADDYCDACIKQCIKTHKQNIEEDFAAFKCKGIPCEICTNYINSKKKKSNKKKFYALWYSVSPPRGDPYKMAEGLDFVRKMDKFFKSVSIEKAIWTYEFKYKGGPLEFYGIHCHSLIFGQQKKINWHIARQTEKYFNLNDSQKFVIYEGDEELIKDKIDYFTGKTWEEGKNEEKAWDKNTREEHGLKQIYFKKCDFEALGISSSNNAQSSTNVVKFE